MGYINERRNLVYIEFMRIMATFFVIFNHTGMNGFFLFSKYETSTLHFWIYLFISVFCKFSVPLFLAISGAVLLKKENESIGYVWTHRIKRIFCALLVFSFFYYLRNIYYGSELFSLNRFALHFYKDSWNFSFWYLYTFLAFLISLPLLRKLHYNLCYY